MNAWNVKITWNHWILGSIFPNFSPDWESNKDGDSHQAKKGGKICIHAKNLEEKRIIISYNEKKSGGCLRRRTIDFGDTSTTKNCDTTSSASTQEIGDIQKKTCKKREEDKSKTK